MSPHLSTRSVIAASDLIRIGRARLREARILHEAGQYAGSVYLAGFAVECALKFAICWTLGWRRLSGTFKTHDLEALLLHSGLEKTLRSDPAMNETFGKITGLWSVEGDDSVRYQNPREFNRATSEGFLAWVAEPEEGFLPWLRRQR